MTSRRGWLLIAAGVLLLIGAGIGWRLWLPPRPSLEAPPAAAAAQFVGADVCGTCHASEHAAWRGSDHDLAMQIADASTVLGDFDNATFTYAGTTTTFLRRDDKFVVNTDGEDGELHDYAIGYTFGVRPLQQYLIDFPGGRKQVLSIAWDTRPRERGGQRWFHLYPDDNVKAGDWLHWTNYSQNWNFTCAECHSTDLRKNFDAASNTYDTTWAEIDVACEACHGPGSDHVAWAHKQGDWRRFESDKGLAVALDERRGVVWRSDADGKPVRSQPRSSAREIGMCARCHARASRLTDEYVYGAPPLDSHRLVRLDDELYWPDGQMRAEVYNWGSFLQSKMYAHGVTCADCHDPHSLQLRSPGNAVCGQCHQASSYDTPAHTHHAAGSAGAACAACHMPTTTYMVIDPRHDHSMRIPRPDQSDALGTPNACTACHDDRTAQWAAAAIARWSDRPPDGYQTFGAAFHAATIGAPGARDGLVAIIADPNQPALVRASAIDHLAPWLTPGTLATVTAALRDPDPNVVLAAVEALADTDADTRQRYLTAQLVAPVLAVRIAAARALAGPTEQRLSNLDHAAFERALAEYVAVQNYTADRPEGHTNLGNLYAQRGANEAAMAQYRQAIAIDPQFVAAYANMADLYRAGGGEARAEAVLRQGIVADPQAAPLQYALGLSLSRQGRQADALAALKASTELEPGSARFAYVYAVALHDAGRPDAALAILNTAQKKAPNDRDVLSALVYYSAESGQVDAARDYAMQLVRLEPENPEYVRLAAQLGGGA
jgi:tetratricopeptide (TPR) repeat protein